MLLGHAVSAIKHAPPPPPFRARELTYVGCLPDTPEHALAAGAWPIVLARGRTDAVTCAKVCEESVWFAMQGGYCQCAAALVQQPPPSDPAGCGGLCADGSPCGRSTAPALNAVFAQATGCDRLGARLELGSATADRDKQWKGRSATRWRSNHGPRSASPARMPPSPRNARPTIRPRAPSSYAVVVAHWQEGATVELDWGMLPVSLLSVWNAAYWDNLETGPRTTLVLRGNRNAEVGFKARGGFPVAPRMRCQPRLTAV